MPELKVGGLPQTALGVLAGVLFLLALRWLMHGQDFHVGKLRGSGVRRSLLVFTVLFIHGLPEGLAMGAAQASDVARLNVFVLAAIGLQNIPEGTAVAIPMAGAGFGKSAQFWAAVLTSLPQPVGAPLAFVLVDRIRPLLPISMGFAAGAMLAVVAAELVPDAFGRKLWRQGAAGALAGVLVTVALSAALGV